MRYKIVNDTLRINFNASVNKALDVDVCRIYVTNTYFDFKKYIPNILNYLENILLQKMKLLTIIKIQSKSRTLRIYLLLPNCQQDTRFKFLENCNALSSL